MPTKKIVCLGGGSRYFAWALPDLLAMQALAGSEIVLYDIDREKSELMAKHAQSWAAWAGNAMHVRAVHDLAEALDGADFAVSSIGGSGVSGKGIHGTSFHMQDILIPMRYGINQTVGDTCGPAGMMMGLRSVPVYVGICREMEKRCPQVILLQHSNPMAIICRAVCKYTGIRIIGICHGVQNGLRHLGQVLGVPPEDLDAVWIGTNHYHWLTHLRYRGQDIYPELRLRLRHVGPPAAGVMTQKLSDIYGYQIVYPKDDHIIEFYPFLTQAGPRGSLPYGLEPSLDGLTPEQARERLQQPAPSEAMRQAQRHADLRGLDTELAAVEPRQGLSSRITGEGLGRLIEAISLGRRELHIANVPNQAAVPNLPPHAILELESVTDSSGVRPICVGEAPLVLAGLLHKRIAWQELVVDAAVKGDRNLALQALLLDEMAILPEKAEAMLDELLAASRDMLPNFNWGSQTQMGADGHDLSKAAFQDGSC